jgi:hypothetical protein
LVSRSVREVAAVEVVPRGQSGEGPEGGRDVDGRGEVVEGSGAAQTGVLEGHTDAHGGLERRIVGGLGDEASGMPGREYRQSEARRSGPRVGKRAGHDAEAQKIGLGAGGIGAGERNRVLDRIAVFRNDGYVKSRQFGSGEPDSR